MRHQQTVENQIADDDGRENRNLPQTVHQRCQAQALDQQQRRQTDPGNQWQAHQPQGQARAEKPRVTQQGKVALADLTHGKGHADLLLPIATDNPHGLRHTGVKPQPDQHRSNAECQKQLAPCQPFQ